MLELGAAAGSEGPNDLEELCTVEMGVIHSYPIRLPRRVSDQINQVREVVMSGRR